MAHIYKKLQFFNPGHAYCDSEYDPAKISAQNL